MNEHGERLFPVHQLLRGKWPGMAEISLQVWKRTSDLVNRDIIPPYVRVEGLLTLGALEG